MKALSFIFGNDPADKPSIREEDFILLLHRELDNMQQRGVTKSVTRWKGDVVEVEGQIDLTILAKAMMRMVEEGPPVHPVWGERR